MATTGTLTIRDTLTQAMRKAGVLSWGETLAAEDAQAARDELNLMLKGWQNKGYNLWTKTAGSLALTTAASYTLDPVRPLKILSARFKRTDGSEIQMERLTRDEYDRLTLKTTVGIPTQFYYDRQREAARLYVWPVLGAASGQTIEFTYERETDDITSLDAELDVPSEWFDAVIYNLAARIAETVPMDQPPMLFQRAQMLLNEALAFDREGSVYFAGEYAE